MFVAVADDGNDDDGEDGDKELDADWDDKALAIFNNRHCVDGGGGGVIVIVTASM